MALEVASLYAKLGLDDSGFHSGLGRAKDGIGVFGIAAGNVLGNVAMGVGRGLADVAGGVASVVTSSIGMASDMEAQLSSIGAVMGVAKDELAPLKELIVDLGIDPNLKVNATEAADAIEMLARNGLDMTQILDGAAKSTVLLANSTGGAFDVAANIATDSMAIFNIEAEDMMDAVNGITSVTTGSKFDINDYGLALAQAGGVAATVGVDFDDFNTVIAGISPLFASGSDAGTSFKTMLQRLEPSTNPAIEAMTKLGIITEDGANQFFTATGELKSMSDVAGIMQGALSGLSEEQRSSALSTIFGTDAMRAAAGMMTLGADGFDELQSSMGQTDAMDSAAARMDNFAGTMEIISGVFDGWKLKLGDSLLPTVQKFADKLLILADDIGPKVIEFAEGAGEKLFAWVEQIEQGDFSGVMDEAGGLLTTAWDTYVVPALSEFSAKFWDWVTGPGGAVEGAGEALTALTTTASDWLVENWPMIQESLSEWGNKFWDWVTGPDGALIRLGETMNQVTANITTWAESEEGQGELEIVGETLGRALITGLQKIFDVDTWTAIKSFGESAGEATLNLKTAFIESGAELATGLISGIYEELTGNEFSEEVTRVLRAALKGAIEAALSILSPADMIKVPLGNLGAALGLGQHDSGGVVAGATGSPQLVIAHGGETILPTHKGGSQRAGGSTYNISINANDAAGGQRAGNAFVNALRLQGVGI